MLSSIKKMISNPAQNYAHNCPRIHKQCISVAKIMNVILLIIDTFRRQTQNLWQL